MIEVLLRNILGKAKAEREAKRLKGKAVIDDLNAGRYMIIQERE